MNLSLPRFGGSVGRVFSTGQIMLHVLVALLPGIVVYATWLDSRIVPNMIAACLSAVIAEALFLSLRNKALLPILKDGSILVAACLLTLCLPPSLPLWQLVLGVFIMAGLGKHVFGGLGHNPFNPAMVAYAVLLVSFPITMTDWQLSADKSFPADTSVAKLANIHSSNGAASRIPDSINTSNPGSLKQWDGLSGATPLDSLRAIRTVQAGSPDKSTRTNSYRSEARTLVMDSRWVWLSVTWLLGGCYLLALRIISWHTPASVLLTIALFYAATDLVGFAALPVTTALLSGAIMFGAFFIATDPVTAPASRRGQLIYGAGIGMLAFFIREYSVYPEGVAFAVLLMNITVPLIDHSLRGKHGNSSTPRGPHS